MLSSFFLHSSHTNTNKLKKEYKLLCECACSPPFIRGSAISLKKQFPNTHQKHNYMFETRNMKFRLGFSFIFGLSLSLSASLCFCFCFRFRSIIAVYNLLWHQHMQTVRINQTLSQCVCAVAQCTNRICVCVCVHNPFFETLEGLWRVLISQDIYLSYKSIASKTLPTLRGSSRPRIAHSSRSNNRPEPT